MATSTQAYVQLVEKDNYENSTIVSVPDDATSLLSKPLPQSSVVVRAVIMGLTTNNLSYARAGRTLHWWDAYPLPPQTPAEFSSEKYGIAPGWGYAVIVASSIPSLPVGDHLRGFWPFNGLPTLLKLETGPASDTLIEQSPHRQAMMPFYNQYFHEPHLKQELRDLRPGSAGSDRVALTANMLALWQSGFLLNRFSFGSNLDERVHPFGMGLDWAAEDADLRGAVVVCLAASSRTALSFAYNVRHVKASAEMPKALVGMTSTGSISFVKGTEWFDEVIEYGALASEPGGVENVMKTHQPDHVVILDFGGRDGACMKMHQALKPQVKTLTVVKIGGEVRPMTPKDLETAQGNMKTMDAKQMNASAIREDAVKKIGDERYTNELLQTWGLFLDKGGLPGVKLTWGQGVKGEQGIEGGWKAACQGDLSSQEARVYTF